MHMNMSQEAFVRKITRKTPDAHPAASMWCEPAQSKCIRTCHKRHFVRKFTGKCRKLIPQQAFCATCAVEMHMDMSQEAFCAEIYRENAGPLIPQQAFCATCAVEMHMDMSQEAFVRKFTRKTPDANPAASMWCEPAQSKCIWTCHKRHLCGNLQGKCQTPGIPPRLNNGP